MTPTSKVGLKQMCLMASNGDLEKAQKLYDYMIKDLEDLPIFEPIKPTTIQQVKQGVNDTVNWIKDNQNELMSFAEMMKGLFGRGASATASNAIPTATPIPNPNPIPPIN